ncbi:hypothetical protein [Mesorhizobium shangrilense]|uniref:Uncharacterized protein n=1 Tax=Mesorhizobium shangrilense TaxID=460060 RepID=A0ABV2DTT5_9HYPH
MTSPRRARIAGDDSRWSPGAILRSRKTKNPAIGMTAMAEIILRRM